MFKSINWGFALVGGFITALVATLCWMVKLDPGVSVIIGFLFGWITCAGAIYLKR